MSFTIAVICNKKNSCDTKWERNGQNRDQAFYNGLIHNEIVPIYKVGEKEPKYKKDGATN